MIRLSCFCFNCLFNLDLSFKIYGRLFPQGIYQLKVNNRNTRLEQSVKYVPLA